MYKGQKSSGEIDGKIVLLQVFSFEHFKKRKKKKKKTVNAVLGYINGTKHLVPLLKRH
jgi:hypothetical protein